MGRQIKSKLCVISERYFLIVFKKYTLSLYRVPMNILWVFSVCYSLGATFDFDRLGLTGPPEGLLAGRRWARGILPLELHLGDLGPVDEEIHARALAPAVGLVVALRDRRHFVQCTALSFGFRLGFRVLQKIIYIIEARVCCCPKLCVKKWFF